MAFTRKNDFETLYASEVNEIYTAIELGEANHNTDIDAIEQSLVGKANVTHTHTVSDITAMGNKNATTFLRGDDSWARPADTKIEHMPMHSGRTYSTISHGLGRAGAGAMIALPINTLRLTPIQITDDVVVSAVGIHNGTGVAGGFIRLGIFNVDLTTYTANLIRDCGTVTTDTTGDKEVGITLALDAGTYWLGCVSSVAATIMQGPPARSIFHTPSYATVAALSTAFTYAAFPASIPTVSDTSVDMPYMHVGVA